MGDTMLHAVLNMPPDLWGNDPVDQLQRFSRYREASRRILDLEAWVLYAQRRHPDLKRADRRAGDCE